MVTLYNVVSTDGFIARPDGGEDFIPDSHWPQTLGVLKGYDSVVMGRKTYEAIQKYDNALRGPFESLPNEKIVVTTDHNFRPKSGYSVAYSPEELPLEKNIVVTSGPILNNYLLDKGLVDRVLFHKIPVVIGEGITPYGDVPLSIEKVELPSATISI